MMNAKRWTEVLNKLGVRVSTAAMWAPHFAATVKDSAFSLGYAELDDFLGQILHESRMLEALEESLYYSTPGRLMAVWPSRFKTLEDERAYRMNPRALANLVYGGRMGNVNEDDGWRYRGSGLIHLTGADNYREVQRITGHPVFDTPELLREVGPIPILVSIAWWEGNIPDAIMGDIRKVSRAVNGGLTGLAERKRLTDEAGDALA